MTSKTLGPDQVHFTLLENGLDFVWSAVEHLSVGTAKRELKYALLHLVSGIELILKERLRREDWKLLFPNPGKANESSYKSGSFKSVDFMELIERVEGYCYDGTWEAAESLQALRRQRNRFEHFEATTPAAAVIASTAEALGVVLDFIREQLSGEGDDFTANEEALLSAIRGKLTGLADFVEARLKSIAPEVERAPAVLTCPVCRQEALSVDDGVECLFCGYKAEGETAADAYVANVMDVSRYRREKDGGVWPVSQCPSCDWIACVDSGDRYLCFGCGSTWQMGDLEECGRCGRLRVRDDDGPTICGDCLDDLVSRSD